MKISVRPQDIRWNDELQERVEHRIVRAVNRHRARLAHVSVRVTDLNGPRGGVDKLCQIIADLKGSTPVLILETGEDLLTTVNRAARRLGYRVGKKIQLLRTPTACRSRNATRAGGMRRRATLSDSGLPSTPLRIRGKR